MLINSNFVHLHVRTDYSIIDGLGKIKEFINEALKLKMPSFAITDFTNIFGIVKFYTTAYKVGIKPIIGADFLLKNELLNEEITNVTILACNNIGYKNLILLISNAHKYSYQNNIPVITLKLLILHNSGLILISGAQKGDIGKCLLQENYTKIKTIIKFYKKYFPDSFYLEINRIGNLNEEKYINYVIEIAKKYELPLVATNNVCFIKQSDFESHEIRVAINGGYTVSNNKYLQNYSKQQYFCDAKTMQERFIDLPESLINSVEIAKRCNVNIPLGKYFLPNFPTEGMKTKDYLTKIANQGLEKKIKTMFENNNEKKDKIIIYKNRLKKELNIINEMNFPGYFLIVMEFINWAKKNNIPVGPGRGSGAGSLVAFVLNITDIDPILFDLIFERFLNPERISMPDLDIDFCMEKRDLVINHVSEKYGKDSVSQIITFGTMTAKAVIRDVGRVLEYPYNFIIRISKLIPNDPGITLHKALCNNSELKNLYKTDEEIKTLIDMSRKLEGTIRNIGKHAGGVVISPTKITDFMPLYYDNKGKNTVTQFDKNDIDKTGLVKFDFLGLRTLTVINETLEMINSKNKQKNINKINISNINLNDKKCFEILKQAKTTAIFQLESHGMKNLIKNLKPDCFEDIIALLALFRPGPLKSGMVENFINRKHGKEIIAYPDCKWQHKLLEPVLKSTYGIILYQEQIIKIAQVLAGYSLGKADILRRAIEKKKKEEIEKQRTIFKKGSEKLGINTKLSEEIFNIVEKFSGYSFNKSHSAAYALISYQTLWLKTYYTAEFMSAVMTSDMDNTEKIIISLNECKNFGIKVLPPNVNYSKYNFHVNKKNQIVWGLGAIKGVGKSAINNIIDARNKGGNFNGLFDFCIRTNMKKINQNMQKNLIMSGSLDDFSHNRASLINVISKVIKLAEQHNKSINSGQKDLFNTVQNIQEEIKNELNKVNNWPEQIILDGEIKTLGVYLTNHPISQYISEIKYYTNNFFLKDIKKKNKKSVVIAGLVISKHIIRTKNKNKIGICIIDDNTAKLEILLFEKILEKYEHLLEKNNILIIKGNIYYNKYKDNLKLITHEIVDINQAREKYIIKINILLKENQINDSTLNKLNLLLNYNPLGTTPIVIYYQQKNLKVCLYSKKKWLVTPNNKLLNKLRILIGEKNVSLKFK